MALQKIPRRTLSDEVFDQLSSEIVEGRFEPGDHLPAERDLVTQLGVNRGAVREALKRLAQAGLVAIQQGGGTKVLDYRRSAGLELLGRLLLKPDGNIDLHVARSIVEMRAALAPDIARLCARRATPQTVAELNEVVSAMEREDDLDRLQVLALRFWEELVRGADNIAYELAFNTLRQIYELIREALVQVLADELRDFASYRSIVDAVDRGDDVAARHVAGALIEKGTHRVVMLTAMLGLGQRRSRNGEEKDE